MRCAQARRWISDGIDGHLGTKKRAALKEHLQSCPDCQSVLEDLKNVVKKAHELEELSPSSQAWLRIQSRLKTEAQSDQTPAFEKKKWFDFLLTQPKLKYALSAALLLVIALGLVVLGLRYGKGIFGGVDPQQYTLSKLKEAERHYQKAIKALAEAVSVQQEGLDPEVAGIFRMNLEIIDASIAACKRAVLNEPENIEARDYLLYAYSKKLDLLDEMAAIKSTVSPEREGKEIL